MEDKDRCQGGDGYCANKAASPHFCPFQYEINNDKAKCKCCQDCRAGCAEEV